MADLNTWKAALDTAHSTLPERQGWAVHEAKLAFYIGLPAQMPNDLTDEAAALMVEELKFYVAARPRKEAH